MKLTDKINFKQPKYMLPLIIGLPVLGNQIFIFDMFDTKLAETKDANMQTTEYLNPNLPQAQIKSDGIGGKYENMVNSYGKIEDKTAVNNIEMEENNEKNSMNPNIQMKNCESWMMKQQREQQKWRSRKACKMPAQVKEKTKRSLNSTKRWLRQG